MSYGRPGMIGLDSGGGGGTSVSSWWNPLLPQSPQHAKTTYFPGTSLPAGVTEFDQDTKLVVSVANGLKMVHTHNAAFSNAGVSVVAPADNKFSITAMIGMDVKNLTAGSSMIFVAEATGWPTTADMVTLGGSINGATASMDNQHLSAYNAWGSTPNTSAIDLMRPTKMLVRLFVDRVATTILALASEDGRHWVNLGSSLTFAAAGLTSVDYFGIVSENRTGADLIQYSPMLRIDIDDDPRVPCGGLVGSVAA